MNTASPDREDEALKDCRFSAAVDDIEPSLCERRLHEKNEWNSNSMIKMSEREGINRTHKGVGLSLAAVAFHHLA